MRRTFPAAAEAAALASLDAQVDHDGRLIRAIRNPLRRDILLRLSLREGHAREIADEIATAQGITMTTQRVSNHIRALRDLGLVELVREERFRGGTRLVYRGAGDLLWDEQWARLPVALRRATFQQTLSALAEDIERARRADGFDDPDVHVSRAPLELDERGYDEVRDLLNATLRRVLEINAEADERRAHGASATRRRTRVAILHFDMP